MDDEKVRAIFFRHLEDKDSEHAAVETYREIGEHLLSQVFPEGTLDQSTREKLFKIIAGFARLTLYSSFTKRFPDQIIGFGSEHFDDIKFLYSVWAETLVDLVQYSDQMLSEEMKSQVSFNDLKLLAENMERESKASIEQIETSGIIPVHTMEFYVMGVVFRWGLLARMGDETLNTFNDELKKYITWLRFYHIQISAKSSGKKPS